ncbi:MAG: DEAD/DEAH box helicase [Brevinema sp.]
MSMLSLEISAKTSHRLIKELIITLYASEEISNQLEQRNPSFISISHKLSQQERSFLSYWKKITTNQKDKYTFLQSAPFSYDLLQFIGTVPTKFHVAELGISIENLQASSKPFAPKYLLNIGDPSINFNKNDHSLLFPSIFPYIQHDQKISKIDSPFCMELLEELYEKNTAKLSLNDASFLTNEIRAENNYFTSLISAPKIIKSKEMALIFEFNYQSEKYEIELFIEALVNKKLIRFSLPLEKTQQYLKNNQALTLLSKDNNAVLQIDRDDPIMEKIERTITAGFKNFYTILGEICNNKIITTDKSNLFESFLPKVIKDVHLVKANQNKKLRFLLEETKPNVIIKNSSQTPLFGSTDWLSVDFEFDHHDFKLTLKDLANIIKHGFIEKNDSLIILKESEIDPISKLLDLSKKRTDDQLQIQASFLPWLLSLYPQAVIPNEWSVLKNFITKNTIPEIHLSQFAEDTLRDYQKTGVRRLGLLHEFGFGSVLADEMGLGKTLQILTLLDVYSKNGKTLIVTPSALTLNWKAEIEKFYPKRFKTLIIQGTKEIRNKKIDTIEEYDIIITSYHTLGSDQDRYEKLQFEFLVIDEAQHIKNKNSRRSKSVKSIVARSRIAVSGTPLENNITELWSIFDFIMPDFLGTHKYFQHHFAEPLKNFDTEKRKEILSRLQQMTSPFIIRRTKATTYKELPPKIEQTIISELTTKQKALYLDTLSQVRHNFFNLMETKKFNQSRIDFLSVLTKLRQIALHPGLVYPELLKENSELFSSKITILSELLQEAFDSGHRVLIFSQFVSMLSIIKQELIKKNMEFLYIDGKTDNRVDLCNQFNTGTTPLFLISLKAGGIGLNLTGADTVILFDPWWNPSVENQAIDRAHRIGQNKIVNVYRLMTKGTIEEKIYNLQRKKEFLFDNIMQENPNFETFSSEELLSLLNIDDELFDENK